MSHFRTCFSRPCGAGLTVGLDDLRGLFQPECFYDSTILRFAREDGQRAAACAARQGRGSQDTADKMQAKFCCQNANAIKSGRKGNLKAEPTDQQPVPSCNFKIAYKH